MKAHPSVQQGPVHHHLESNSLGDQASGVAKPRYNCHRRILQCSKGSETGVSSRNLTEIKLQGVQ